MTLGVSENNGVWGGVDAPLTRGGVPKVIAPRQRTIALAVRNECRCIAPFFSGSGCGVIGSMERPSLMWQPVVGQGESKGGAFPWGRLSRGGWRGAL